MNECRWVKPFAVLAFLLQTQALPQSDVAVEIDPVAPFDLTTLDGSTVMISAKEDRGVTVVCFLGTECPLARLYAPRLAELAEQFAAHGVQFVGFDSNCQDSADELQRFVTEFHLPFPVAKDRNNVVADKFHAERMCEVFVLDNTLRIRYHGRIDDRYRPGIARTVTTVRDDLRIALEELLAGKPVSVPETDVAGCLIGRVRQGTENATFTYCRNVARILQANCVECHQAGEIGPFALTDYDEVVGWADMMVEVIDDGRMPPWHASPDHGRFANARLMSESDKQVLREWVAAGAPYGNAADLPPPSPPARKWHLSRKPDQVIAMRDRPFVVPAEGTVEYQYFVVDPGFKEDEWVTGAQVIPGCRSVVHHCIVFVRPPDGQEFRGVSWLTAYVPGQRVAMLPPGYGRHVPAGSQLVFQMHYTPNGSEQSDLSQVGLMFGDESEITHELYSQIGLEQEFEIPPHAANYTVTASPRRLPEHGTLLAVAPHMHLRGKSFRLISRQADAEPILLDVPRYDFNWQHVYEFAKPLPLESIGKLKFIATFDNSDSNPVNPDPTQHVTWGDQTWEEMAVAFFEIAVPRQDTQDAKRQPVTTAVELDQRDERVQRITTQFFARFDANTDGQIHRSELPLSTERFGLWQWDENGDGRL
ncbi:MAG TPA: redoxin domain-containing protein, partial [Lacipirellulaceae bacterium]